MTISRFFLFIALILLNFNLLAENKNNQFIVPDDLKVIPQNVKTFASSNSSVFSSEIGSEKRFKESVTAPWRIKKNAVNINDFNKYAFAPIDKCFGLNFQTYNKDTIFDIRANAMVAIPITLELSSLSSLTMFLEDPSVIYNLKKIQLETNELNPLVCTTRCSECNII